MASTHLTRSITSTNTSWTLSVWLKRAMISTTQYIMSWGSSGSTGNGIGFSNTDFFQYYSEATSSNPASTGKFRDTCGWYHAVIKNDAGTITLYMNGETLNITGGTSGSALNSSTMRIGDWVTGAYHYDGSMSHLHFIDGTAYSASAFGSTDSTTGEWKINTNPSVTYGSDGFFILKDGNSLTDQSGNGNNYTLAGGTITKTEDNPSDVFATFNELGRLNNFGQRYVEHLQGATTSKGTSSANNGNSYSTLGAASGKFYCEIKATGIQGSGYPNIGFMDEKGAVRIGGGSGQISTSGGTCITPNGRLVVDGTETASWSATFTNNDIIQLAMDLDNGALYFGKNGTWQNSGNPASGASKTGAARSFTPDGTFYFFAVANYTSSSETQGNFGNGYFGSTAISSAGTNASNSGIFEYDVPAGYTALSTKGINSF